MTRLKPVKLHTLIGTATEWTDELWNEALAYLLESTATHDAIIMAITVRGDSLPDYPHKIDFLREFRKYPPTTLLGAPPLLRPRNEFFATLF